MAKRKPRTLGKSNVTTVFDRQILLCRECQFTEMEVSGDVGAVVCPNCVQRWIGAPPEAAKKEKSDKPRGWHLKAYFEHDGVVYSKGEAVTDPKQITELRNAHGKPATSTKPAKKPAAKKTKTASKRGTKHARSTK